MRCAHAIYPGWRKKRVIEDRTSPIFAPHPDERWRSRRWLAGLRRGLPLETASAALKGIAQYGWEWRLKLANEAQKRNRDERGKQERTGQLCCPWRDSTRDL